LLKDLSAALSRKKKTQLLRSTGLLALFMFSFALKCKVQSFLSGLLSLPKKGKTKGRNRAVTIFKTETSVLQKRERACPHPRANFAE
jgi:hypothetical protein